MNRRALIVVSLLAAAAACHPMSLRSRAKSLAAGIADLGAKTVAIVKPVAPKIHVDADVQAAVTNAVRANAQQRIAAQEPIVISKSVRRDDRPSVQQAPADVPVTIHRTQAPPTVFVMHGTTFGGRAVCEQFTAMDTCTSSCTNALKVNAWNPKASTDPNGMKSCSCVELDRGC